MIKNIIFDFDGVLVDSETIVLKAFSQYMQEYRKTIKQNVRNSKGLFRLLKLKKSICVKY